MNLSKDLKFLQKMMPLLRLSSPQMNNMQWLLSRVALSAAMT